ncbi:hypothetical protein ACIBG7_36250 [Nonomuraea sp. NPDC050328]|uniref:hypothetical protein n=1 Tax=Nonomuraea sp. NPDC050328 TaxID=3364361 RepID=UPI003799C24E
MKFSSLPDEECRPAAFSDNKIPPFDGSLKVGIGPRMAGNWPHEAPALRTEFRQDTSGEIQVPRTEPWHLTDVLASFGDESAESGNRQTLSLLKDASWRHHSVHAAVELKKPLNEEEAGKIHDISLGEVALLSPGRGNKPIGWPFAFPGTIGDFHVSGGRPSTSRLEEFRQWVSLLQPEDEFALQAIGLDLTELRRSANDGLIHGFTIINTPEAIARMAKNPKVRSVRVIEIVPSALN